MQSRAQVHGVCAVLQLVSNFVNTPATLFAPSVARKVLSRAAVNAWTGLSSASRLLMTLLATLVTLVPLHMAARAIDVWCASDFCSLDPG